MLLSTGRAPRTAVPWLRVGAVLLVLVVLGLAAPLALLALQTSLSLLAVLLLALVGLAVLHALPLWLHRLELRLLRARMDTARAHPLEELQGQLLARSEQVARYRDALLTIHGQIVGMRELLEVRQRAEPGHDVSRQASALARMEAFHTSHVHKLGAAQQALQAMREHLVSKQFEWSFAQAGQDALASLSSHGGEAVLNELLSDEASRAVRLSFDRVFAELDGEPLHTLVLAGREPS